MRVDSRLANAHQVGYRPSISAARSSANAARRARSALLAASAAAASAEVLSQARELGLEAASVDQFHAEVVLPSVFAHFVNGNDVRMIELGGGFGFGVETLHVSCRGELPGQEQFQGHRAVEAYLPGLVDDTHPAARDLLQ